jgi:hypothetical protein
MTVGRRACCGALVIGMAVLTHHATAQTDTALLKRWVGNYPPGRVLNLEFYGDTMLVLNDRHGLSVRITTDSIIGTGDTTFTCRYRTVLGRLLLEAPDGTVITMASQPALARPFTGRWLGELAVGDRPAAEIIVYEYGTAKWRRVGEDKWITGEWERATRVVTFTWSDNTEWTGQYDPIGNAVLFEQTVAESGTSVFRRTFH